MLNQQDLKEIRKIVSDEISLKTDPLSKDIHSLQSDVQTLKNDNHAFKRNFVKIHKDMNLIINFFDHEYLELKG